jgi:hypothetical protein
MAGSTTMSVMTTVGGPCVAGLIVKNQCCVLNYLVDTSRVVADNHVVVRGRTTGKSCCCVRMRPQETWSCVCGRARCFGVACPWARRTVSAAPCAWTTGSPTTTPWWCARSAKFLGTRWVVAPLPYLVPDTAACKCHVHVSVFSFSLSKLLRSNRYTQPYRACLCFKMCELHVDVE